VHDRVWKRGRHTSLQVQCALTELERVKSIFPEEQDSKTLQPLETQLRDLVDAKHKRSQRVCSTLPTGSLIDYDASAPGPPFHSAQPWHLPVWVDVVAELGM
jgi:hypothetical protein